MKKTITKPRALHLATLAHVTGGGFSTSPSIIEENLSSSFVEENSRPKGSIGTSPG